MATTLMPKTITGWAEQDYQDYLAHNREVLLRSIESDEALDRALKKIDALLDAPSLSLGSEKYLDTLSDLVGVYEANTVHVPALGGVAMLRHLMEENALQQKDLAALFGGKSVVSAVLSGRRHLALTHIARLADFFQVPAGIFIDAPST